MKRSIIVGMLLLSVVALAQQASLNPVALALHRSFHVDLLGSAKVAQDPLQSPQSSEVLTSPEVQQQILNEFQSMPALSGYALNVKVDDNSVLISGEVHSEKEHQLALRIVQSYADTREIFDRITANQPM